MTSMPFLTLLGWLEVAFCLAALCAILAKKQWKDYWSLGAFLAVRAFSSSACMSLIHFHDHTLNVHLAYVLYFYVYWISFAVELVLALFVVYSVFRLAMAPLKGLQQLGMLVFRWAASISVVVALGSAFAPEMTSTKYLIAAISQLQRTQSVLTLCLLVFVCFAILPMGLNYGSRIFGVSHGLGMLATNDLLQTAWFSPPGLPTSLCLSQSAASSSCPPRRPSCAGTRSRRSWATTQASSQSAECRPNYSLPPSWRSCSAPRSRWPRPFPGR